MNKRALLPLLLLTACAHHVDERYERRTVYGQPPVEHYERREVYRPPVVQIEHHEHERERREYGRAYPAPVYPAARPVVQPTPYPVQAAPYPTRPTPQVVQPTPYPVAQPRPVVAPVMQPTRPSVQPSYPSRPATRNDSYRRDGGHEHRH